MSRNLSPIYTTYRFNHDHYKVYMKGEPVEDWCHVMEDGVEVFEHNWRTGERLEGNPVLFIAGKWDIVCIGEPSIPVTPPIVSKSIIKSRVPRDQFVFNPLTSDNVKEELKKLYDLVANCRL